MLHEGRVVERGAPHTLFSTPQHPYTQALLAAIPEPDGTGRIPDAPSAEDRIVWAEVPPVAY